MAAISRQTIGKALVVTLVSAGISVLISLSVVPLLGGTYDGIGLWLSILCPLIIAFPASTWQFHQSEKFRRARDELALLHVELDRVHSELIRANATLEHKARHDAMTGGLTREAFFQALDTASRSDVRSAVLVADADHFKRINDSFGHQTGDEALIAIATAIRTTLGLSDFWGRIGGEEFAIYLQDAAREDVAAVAETIRRGAEATEIRRESGRVPVSLSIGGICLNGPFNAHQAMSDADRRLYRAKRGGRNRVILDEIADDDAAAA